MVTRSTKTARPFARATTLLPAARLASCILLLAGYVLLLSVHPAQVAPEASGRSPIDEKTAEMKLACVKALESRDWAKAAELSTRLRAMYPENDVFIRQFASAKHGLAEYDEEAKAWEVYMLVAPVPIDACPAIGQAWQKAGDGEKALRAFKRCWQLKPQNSDGLFNYARALEHTGNHAEAAATYRSGLQQSPKNFDLTVGLGRVLLRSGDVAEAKRLAQQVLVERPDYSDALLLLGAAHLKGDDREAAKAAFRHGIEVSPRYADLYILLGRILADEKKTAEAESLFRKALEIDPSREDAKRQLAGLQVTP